VFARVRSFVRNVLSRDRVERDLDDELQAALDLLIDEELEKGKSPADAPARPCSRLAVSSR
jgi:hypothetical protein